MSVRIRRISARSAFMVALVIYGAVGLVVGLALVVVTTVELHPEAQPGFAEDLGLWSLLLFPVAYGLLGGISAAVAAVLYNAAAAVVGGIKVEIPDIESGRDGTPIDGEGRDAPGAPAEERPPERRAPGTASGDGGEGEDGRES